MRKQFLIVHCEDLANPQVDFPQKEIDYVIPANEVEFTLYLYNISQSIIFPLYLKNPQTTASSAFDLQITVNGTSLSGLSAVFLDSGATTLSVSSISGSSLISKQIQLNVYFFSLVFSCLIRPGNSRNRSWTVYIPYKWNDWK